ARMGELADLLATVVDPASSRVAAPRVRAIARDLDDDRRQFDRLPRLSAEEGVRLRNRHEVDQKEAVARYGREVARVRAIPGVASPSPFSPDPLASLRFLPGTDLRIVVEDPARPSAAPS